MKIIKNANETLKEQIIFECLECSCIFSAEKGECVKETDYRSGIYYSAECPNCAYITTAEICHITGNSDYGAEIEVRK